MRCEESRAFIEEYFDGELDERIAAGVKSHIASCHECETLWGELQREQEVYLRYQRDVEVTPALWAGIQTRIAAEKPAVVSLGLFDKIRTWFGSSLSAPRLSFAYAAALVLIAVGATVAVMSYMNSRGNNVEQIIASGGTDKSQQGTGTAVNPPSNTNSQSATTDNQINPAGNDPEENNPSGNSNNAAKPAPSEKARRAAPKPKAQPTPEQLVREAEQKYLAAIAILTKDVNKRMPEIDPMVRARFDSALAAIDKTIEETRQAARNNPNDPIALQYMLAAYAKKVEVLRDIADD